MQRIDFETGAVASLRRRVAEIEEINDDLVAFARGHAGAVSAIHDAVLAALAAPDRDAFFHVLAWSWPRLLKVDAVAIAWSGADAFRADRDGVSPVEGRLIVRMADALPSVTIRPCARAHPLFGASGEAVRSEALIRLDGEMGIGLLALGQKEGASAEGRHGAKLLRFLGASVAHMLERWPAS
jgi:uncharacterized protein